MWSVLLETRKLIYITIPKAGCTSIKIALGDSMGLAVPEPSYVHFSGWPDAKSKEHVCELRHQGYHCFSVVRNPWSRLFSCWRDKIRNQNVVYLQNNPQFHHEMTFPEFVAVICDMKFRRMERHFGEQGRMLRLRGEWIVDEIIRLEELSEKWRDLQTRFHLSPVPWVNRAEVPAAQVLLHSMELIKTSKMIGKKFARDARYFGYHCPWGSDHIRSGICCDAPPWR